MTCHVSRTKRETEQDKMIKHGHIKRKQKKNQQVKRVFNNKQLKASVKEYEDQLENFASDTEIKTIVQSQLTTVKSALNTVKRLEDIIG